MALSILMIPPNSAGDLLSSNRR